MTLYITGNDERIQYPYLITSAKAPPVLPSSA